MNIIGIDIGGTNTDAVLVNKENIILSSVKYPTTEDISVGFSEALKQLQPYDAESIFLGTTHATNAILKRKGLYRVGLIRIAGQRPLLPPAYGWPRDLREAVLGGVETIDGGFECHGGPLTPLSNAKDAIERLLEKGVESIAIVGVFSPINGEQEKQIAELVGQRIPISLSSEIGGIGFIERENSTLLNAALKKVMQTGFTSLQKAAGSIPLKITQNDGSLIDMARAIEYPVLTISAGPTNSFMGGVRLAGLDHAIVVDIGGTSTDVGLVRKGFPIRSVNQSHIGGVMLNFPMPDVCSIAMGGRDLVLKQLDQLIAPLQKKGEVPVLFVGGGSALLPASYFKKGYQKPPYFTVANAYGAALAEISGTVDTVVSLRNREEVLHGLYEMAQQRAVDLGANPATLRLIDQQIIPYSYVPNQMARVVIRYSGKRVNRPH